MNNNFIPYGSNYEYPYNNNYIPICFPNVYNPRLLPISDNLIFSRPIIPEIEKRKKIKEGIKIFIILQKYQT